MSMTVETNSRSEKAETRIETMRRKGVAKGDECVPRTKKLLLITLR
jgi:hypothetical protein